MRIYEGKNVVVEAACFESDGSGFEGYSYRVFGAGQLHCIDFQSWTIPIQGENVLTNEALLTILIHRTKFLNAKAPCHENLCAIAAMEAALLQFKERQERIDADDADVVDATFIPADEVGKEAA